jgi:hypothetical protein
MKAKSTRFAFVIQSYERLDSTVNLIIQLNKFTNYGKIYLSDSGSRGKQLFENEVRDKAGVNINFEYIDNSEYVTATSHMWRIYYLNFENMFLFHDDDLVEESSFLEVLKLLNNNKKINYLCSTNKGDSYFLKNIESLEDQQKINQILKLYFISHNSNCLLITGLFTRYPGRLKNEVGQDFLIEGKYGDVALLSWIFIQKTSKIFNNGYMNYADHDSNDNLVKSLQDRISLSKFVKSQPGFFNNILARLVFYGYRKKRLYFLSGILISIIFPPIWIHLCKKLLARF